MEKAIKISAKMYKCRDSAKRLLGDKYQERLKFYKEIIKTAQKDYDAEVLPSVIRICNLPSITENGMAVMMFMAAAVELIETND